jgi:type IX secretion system PorP/SprF family membrane protein
MMRLISVILIIASLLPGVKARAQADISMATHWYNRANYNPASIARTEYIYLFSNVREQWIGVDGAPKIFNVQASEYFNRMHSAFGISLVGDRIGVTQAYNPMLTYAYRVSNERDWAFSLGLSAGVFTRFVDGSRFDAVTVIDPSIPYNMNSITQPDANFGLEFQSTYFVLSASTTHLFSIGKSDNLFLNTNHRYGSVIFKNTNPEMINYHLGVQVVNRDNLTYFEGNAGIRFKHQTGLVGGPREIFDIGFTYRTSQSMTLLFGLNITQNLRVGYAYDQSFVTGYNPGGTHELMIECRIPSKAASTHCICESQGYWYH